MALATLAACGGGSGATADASAADKAAAGGSTVAGSATTTLAGSAAAAPTSTTNTTNTIAQPANTEGRLLASNCFQCHGTLGLGGFEKIRGSEASEVLEYMTKTASKDIMAAHAQGYTREQLTKIIAYLKQ